MDAQESLNAPSKLTPAHKMLRVLPPSGLHSPHCPNEASFLGLPNEIRNMIYAHVIEIEKPSSCNNEAKRQDDFFTYPKGCVDIRYTPPILRVCSQIRKECHQMFLSATDFVAFVKQETSTFDPKTDPGYGYLLDILAGLGPGHVQTIKSITVVCRDSCGPVDDEQYRLIELWEKFVPALFACASNIDVFRWPGLCIPKLATDAHISLCRKLITGSLSMDLRLQRDALTDNTKRFMTFYRAIIEPTLWINDCNSCVNATEQAKKLVKEGHLQYESLWLAKLDVTVERFNYTRYSVEQDEKRKQCWRRRSFWWKKENDIFSSYRARYPNKGDYYDEKGHWSRLIAKRKADRERVKAEAANGEEGC